jgi:hypothetical protein
VSFQKIIAQLNAQGEPRSAVDPFIASLPQNILSGAVAWQEQALRDQAEEDAAAGKAAYEAEVAKAEAEWTSSLFARAERWREGDPPGADELGVDVAGLSPARAGLVRFAAWLRQTRDQVQHLEGARERFLTDLGAPAVTQQQLDDLIAKDKTGFLAWLKSGADQKTKPTVDAFRRQQIEAKLAEDTYAAEVARDGLKALENEIAILKEAVRLLDERHEKFAKAVLIEEAGPKLAEYRAAADRLRVVTAEVAGLVRAAPSDKLLRGFGLSQVDIRLPAFGGAKPIVIETREIDRAAEPWRERIRALVSDPRAPIADADDR